MKKNIWFITGTNTNVGKTLVSNYILKIGVSKGFDTIGYKPVSSSNNISYKNNESDSYLLKKYSTIKVTNNIINPFHFKKEGPPHMLSMMYDKPISLTEMSKKLHYIKTLSNWIVIEGAGGWYTPLTNDKTFADWVKKENLSVILVVGIKLGCINHAILTQEVIIKNKINYLGWIANHINPYNEFSKQYINTLENLLQLPCMLEIPYLINKDCINKYYKTINIFNDY